MINQTSTNIKGITRPLIFHASLLVLKSSFSEFLVGRDHPEDVISSDEEKELDEIELCISPKRHPYYLRDGQLRSHGAHLNQCFKKRCFLESELSWQSHSRRWEADSNPSSVAHPETEEDSVEDSQKEIVRQSSQEQNSSLTEEFVNNEKLLQESFLSETPQHLHVENSPPESLRDVPLPPKSNEVGLC